MNTYTLKTGFAYSSFNGKIIGKYCQGAGDVVPLSPGCTIIDVADLNALAAVAVYEDPIQAFNVDLFCESLFTAFAADSNLFPYYAVLKDLASFRNFAGMKAIVNALLVANILN